MRIDDYRSQEVAKYYPVAVRRTKPDQVKEEIQAYSPPPPGQLKGLLINKYA